VRGWFCLDFFTVLPIDLIFTAISSARGDAVDGNSFRLLKMIRIVKLMRILRASRIISRWQDHVALSYAAMSLIRFSFGTLLLAHWFACVWGFVGEGDKPFTWSSYGEGLTWRQKHHVSDDAGPYELYGICLYVAFNSIFGGSCEINPASYVEFYVMVGMLVIGSSVWAYVIGSACGIIATLDPAQIEFRQTMDELNGFCREQFLPTDLSVRLREYFRNTIFQIRSRRYDTLLQKMSTRLRGDAAFHMCEFRLRSVPFLVHPDLEPEFMCALAIKSTTHSYSKLERVPCADLFVVERGVVAKSGRLGVAGACFGKDVILSNDSLRDLSDAIALTFVQTHTLTQDDIFGLLSEYPKAHFVVRKAALRMALVTGLTKAAHMLRRAKIPPGHKPSIVEMFDSAMLEARTVAEEQKREDKAAKESFIPLSLSANAQTKAESILKRLKGEMAKPTGPNRFIRKWSTGASRASASASGVDRVRKESIKGNMLERAKIEKLVCGASAPSTQDTAVGSSELAELRVRVDDHHRLAMSKQSELAAQIGALQASMQHMVDAMNAAKSEPLVVRQKSRQKTKKRAERPDAAPRADTVSLPMHHPPVIATDGDGGVSEVTGSSTGAESQRRNNAMERREMRESHHESPTTGSPFDA